MHARTITATLLATLLTLGCADDHDQPDHADDAESSETSDDETSDEPEPDLPEPEPAPAWGEPTCAADGITCVAPIAGALVQVIDECELAAMGWQPAPRVWPASACAAGLDVPSEVDCYQAGPVLVACYAPAGDGWRVLVSPECSRPAGSDSSWPASTCAAGEPVAVELPEIACDESSCSAAHPAGLAARIRLAPACIGETFASGPADCLP